jgi:hypothetical protein
MATVKVPTVNKRKRIPLKAIDQVVEQIVDMLVVMETYLKNIKQSIENFRCLNVMFGVDLVVYTPKHLKNRWK